MYLGLAILLNPGDGVVRASGANTYSGAVDVAETLFYGGVAFGFAPKLGHATVASAAR